MPQNQQRYFYNRRVVTGLRRSDPFSSDALTLLGRDGNPIPTRNGERANTYFPLASKHQQNFDATLRFIETSTRAYPQSQVTNRRFYNKSVPSNNQGTNNCRWVHDLCCYVHTYDVVKFGCGLQVFGPLYSLFEEEYIELYNLVLCPNSDTLFRSGRGTITVDYDDEVSPSVSTFNCRCCGDSFVSDLHEHNDRYCNGCYDSGEIYDDNDDGYEDDEELFRHIQRNLGDWDPIQCHGFGDKSLAEETKVGTHRYFGFELEREFDGGVPSISKEDIKSCFGGMFVARTDGSLNNGIEVVSKPVGYKEVRLLSQQFFGTGDKTNRTWFTRNTSAEGSCGLHIHVSRSSISENTIKLMKQFFHVNKDSRELNIIAGRGVNRWCNRENERDRVSTTSSGKKIYRGNADKYCALNTGRDSTVEFRLFAAPKDANELMIRFQFADSLIKYMEARPMTVKDGLLTMSSYIDWVTNGGLYAKQRWTELFDFLKQNFTDKKGVKKETLELQAIVVRDLVSSNPEINNLTPRRIRKQVRRNRLTNLRQLLTNTETQTQCA